MMVAHAQGMLGAWRSFSEGGVNGELLGGCLLVTVAVLFFALKIVDVSFLRLRTDRRSCLALCMIVALLHVDVLRPDDGATVIPEYTTLVAASWLAGSTRVVRRLTRLEFARHRTTSSNLSVSARSADTTWLDVFRPRCWVLARRVFLLRAPPA